MRDSTPVLTQKDVASKLFMDERTYSKIERGCKKSLDLNMMFNLAEVLQTTIVEILRNPKISTTQAVQPNVLTDIVGILTQVSAQQLQLAGELELIREQLHIDGA